MMKHLAITSIFFTLVAVLFGVTAAGAQGSTDDPAQVETGKAIFETNCAGCHGVDGMGSDRGRNLIGVAAENERSRHVMSVTDGRGFMPGFGANLSADDIDAAISYVRLTFVADAATTDSDAAAPELAVTGGETLPLAVAGAALVAAGAMLIGYTRREP